MRSNILITLLFVTIQLSSQQTDTVPPSKFNILSIGFLNDSNNGALAPNKDDYRTMGFDLRYNHNNNLLFESCYSGMTNRSIGNPLNEGRLDELLIRANYKVFEKHQIGFYPTLGIVLSGDLGGEDLQNSVHEDVDEPLVFLPYDYESIKVSALAGIMVKHNYQINPTHLLSASNHLDFYHASRYSTYINIGSSLIYGHATSNYLAFTLAYQSNNMYGSTTTKAISAKETGLKLSFSQNVAFFTLSYDIFPTTKYGYGRIGINLLNTGDQQEYASNDLMVDFKALTDRGGYYSNYKWQLFTIMEHPINSSLGYMYGTYTTKTIASHPFARGQYLQANLGIETYLIDIRPKFQINPYLGLGLGYKNESTFSGDDPSIETQHSGSPLAYFEGGIRIGGPIKFISKSALLGFLIGDIYTIPFSPKDQMVYDQTLEFLRPDNQFYIGFSFSMDM